MALANPPAGLFNTAVTNLTSALSGGKMFCHAFYGQFPAPIDCMNAVKKLPTGDAEVTFTVHRGPGGNNLPLSRQSGNCMIQVEMAGPRAPPTVDLVPDELRAIASDVINSCTIESGYIGGFATGNLYNMIQWITSQDGDLNRPMPYYTSFPTISVSIPHPEYFSPGDYDPLMAFIFAQAELGATRGLPPGSRLIETLQKRGKRLLAEQKVMEPRGRRIPWWSDPDRPPRLEALMAEGNATADAMEDVPSAGVTLPGSGTGGSSGDEGTQTARKVRRRRLMAGEEGVNA